jgi:hypothetical protein
VYIVNWLSKHGVFTLKDYSIYATPAFSFMVIDILPNAKMSDFVGVMKGLAFHTSKAGRVRLAIQPLLWEDNMLQTILATNHAGHFQRAMPNQLFDNTLKSLRCNGLPS